MTKKIGIYKIVNKINGKVYVGSSVHIERRWRKHKSELNTNKHHSQKLQRSYNKYGIDNFVYEIVELVEEGLLIEKEQHWMDILDSYNNGYNSDPTADRSIISEETKMKISENNSRHWLGVPKTDEIKKKISETKKGMTSPFKGKKHTDETKKKMSEVKMGKKLSKELIEKLTKIRRENPPKNTKMWKLTSPDGEVLIELGLGRVGREFGLKDSHLIQVSKGYRKHHKGWLCEELIN